VYNQIGLLVKWGPQTGPAKAVHYTSPAEAGRHAEDNQTAWRNVGDESAANK
jgi:hypothetical protein